MRSIFLIVAVLCVALVTFVAGGRDFYKILGVDRSSDKADIKKAYKVLSKKYHPDKQGGNSDKFVELSAAYEVLSDDGQRRIYDQYGEEGLQSGGGGGEAHNPFDIFNMFFNRGQQQHQERKGSELNVAVEVSLEELYSGATISVDVSKQVLCDHCNGSGADKASDVTTCPSCNGRGVKTTRHQLAPGMFQTMQTACDACHGKGKVIKTSCRVCHGHKVRRGNEQMTIEIEPGMRDGDRLVFESEGDESPDYVAGDIIFHVVAMAHGVFTRREENLYVQETIGLIEALVGFRRSVTQLDGRIVELQRDRVTPPGFVQEIQGEGMPLLNGPPGARGKLFVEYAVVFPDNFDKAFLDVLRNAMDP